MSMYVIFSVETLASGSFFVKCRSIKTETGSYKKNLNKNGPIDEVCYVWRVNDAWHVPLSIFPLDFFNIF